jgi:hypothetical protein
MNKLVLVLMLSTVAAAATCMHLVRELRTEREHSQTLREQVTQLERAAKVPITPFSTPPIGLAPSDAASDSDTQALTASPPLAAARAALVPSHAAVSPPRATQEMMRTHLERQRKMMQDPEYREAILASQRLGLATSYPNLGSELGLSAEESRRLLDLLAEQQLQMMENQPEYVFTDTPAPAAMQEAQRVVQQRQQQQQSEVETLLGSANYQKWQEYQQTLAERHRAAAIQSSLAMSGAPLDNQQSKALLTALIEEQRKQQREMPSAGYPAALVIGGNVSSNDVSAEEQWLKVRESSYERMVESLDSSLTTQQLSHLQELFEQELEMQRVHMKMLRAQGADPSNNALVGTAGSSVELMPAPVVQSNMEFVSED